MFQARTIADQRREHIALVQRQSDRNAQGFLAAAEENAAVDLPGAVKAGQFLLRNPGQQHEPKSPPTEFSEGSVNIGHCLRHEVESLSVGVVEAQRFFAATAGACPGMDDPCLVPAIRMRGLAGLTSDAHTQDSNWRAPAVGVESAQTSTVP